MEKYFSLTAEGEGRKVVRVTHCWNADSDSLGLGWALRFCFSTKNSGDADVAFKELTIKLKETRSMHLKLIVFALTPAIYKTVP